MVLVMIVKATTTRVGGKRKSWAQQQAVYVWASASRPIEWQSGDEGVDGGPDGVRP